MKVNNGYITSISDEKYLQFMEMSIIFAVPHEALYSLIEHGELVWIEKNKEWAFTKQGLKDIGTISSKKNVQEMSKKFLSNMVTYFNFSPVINGRGFGLSMKK